MFASRTGLRGRLLARAIQRMLDDGRSARPGRLGRAWKWLSGDQAYKSARGAAKADPKVSDAFFAHPLIKYLRADTFLVQRKRPSYIDPETFTKVLVDLLRGPDAKPGISDRKLIEHSLQHREIAWKINGDKLIGGKHLKDHHKGWTYPKLEEDTAIYLESVWADAQGDVSKFRGFISDWFNEMMDRTTGWYKKYTQIYLLIIGLLIAGLFNVDTIRIAKALEANPEMRSQLISQVSAFTKAHPDLVNQLKTDQTALKAPPPNVKDTAARKAYLAEQAELQKKINANPAKAVQDKEVQIISKYLPEATHTLGIGYEGGFGKNVNCLTPFGWLLTAIAISLGAPFWFDLLNKLMQLRSAVAPNEDSKNSGKKGPAPKNLKTVG
ncbi:hypothetical protein [Mucilaginibacter rubeus]|uniref:Uncharacterized protein n=1 Tax=Mucilaginibacter rubeus TaxID=2027860 RepID=A0A5C1HWW9_9SPHI|nr:hypothetical protein [Mucilaginibacter rubeus]QEM10013.1 hypothetical protein DEO27_008255 [Mucilaginibacter rubeus]